MLPPMPCPLCAGRYLDGNTSSVFNLMKENKNVKVPMVIQFFQNVNNTFWEILEYFMKLHFKKGLAPLA